MLKWSYLGYVGLDMSLISPSLPWLLETLTFTHSVALVLVPLDVHRGEVSALAGHTRGPVHTRPA